MRGRFNEVDIYLRDIKRANKYLREKLKKQGKGHHISPEGYLDKELQLELARQYHEGDVEAGQDLVVSYLPMVVSIVRRYINYASMFGLSFMDLISVGNQAIQEALEHFDYKREVKFSTLLGTRIIWYVLNEINLATKERYPDKERGVYVERCLELSDLVYEENGLESVERKDLYDFLLERDELNIRERSVLKLRFGEYSLKLEEVAEVLASYSGKRVSKERIRQIEKRALKKLRENLGEELKIA